MPDERLVDLSVREFVDAVASPERPVPAGGSVAALTAAASAALLELVCGVVQRHRPEAIVDVARGVGRLQLELIELVDEDAAAYRALIEARRGGADVQSAIDAVCRTPLAIASACIEIIDLSQAVELEARGPLLGDVRAARLLAAATLRTALEIAEQNVSLYEDHAARAGLREEISRLRSRQVHKGRSP